jgi:hypothetical protein
MPAAGHRLSIFFVSPKACDLKLRENTRLHAFGPQPLRGVDSWLPYLLSARAARSGGGASRGRLHRDLWQIKGYRHHNNSQIDPVKWLESVEAAAYLVKIYLCRLFS